MGFYSLSATARQYYRTSPSPPGPEVNRHRFAEGQYATSVHIDQFVQGLTADHERVVKMRGLACDLASKQEAIEKKLEEMEKKGLPPGLGPGAPDLMPRPGTTRG